MEIMTNLLKIIYCLLVSSFLTAQTPGFEGKRFSLGVEAQGMPLTGALLVNENFSDFNMRYGFTADIVLSKFVSVGIKFQRSEDLAFLTKYTQSSFTPVEYSQNLDSYPNFIQSFESAANYSYSGFGAYIKLFSKEFGSIAPLGHFWAFEYQLGTINVTDDGRFYDYNRSDIYSKMTHTLVVGTGIQKIYFNRLMTGLSFNLGLNTTGLKSFIFPGYQYGGMDFIQHIERKSFSDNFLTVRFSLAWLL